MIYLYLFFHKIAPSNRQGDEDEDSDDDNDVEMEPRPIDGGELDIHEHSHMYKAYATIDGMYVCAGLEMFPYFILATSCPL